MKAFNHINRPHRESGFTLVELVTIIIITGILAATASTKFMTLKKSADTAACIENQNRLNIAQQAYYADLWSNGTGGNPTTDIDDLAPFLVNDEIPTCPSGGTYSLDTDHHAQCSIPGHILYEN